MDNKTISTIVITTLIVCVIIWSSSLVIHVGKTIKSMEREIIELQGLVIENDELCWEFESSNENYNLWDRI